MLIRGCCHEVDSIVMLTLGSVLLSVRRGSKTTNGIAGSAYIANLVLDFPRLS